MELVKPRFWGDNQDIETPEKHLARQTLADVLEGLLTLLHPFMPHITEEIWHTLTQTGTEDCLALQSYPELDESLINSELETEFQLIIETIRTLRNLRADADIKPKVKVKAILQSQNPQERQILTKGQTYIQDAAKVETLVITDQLPLDAGQTIAGIIGTIQVLVPLAGVVDLESLVARTERKLAKVEKEVEAYTRQLANTNFVEKADTEKVQAVRNNLAEVTKQAEILRDRLNQLNTR